MALFGFTLSYDEFARTLLTAGSNNTLPLEIYGMTTNVTTPVLFALGTVTTLFSFLVIGLCLGGVVLLARRRLASPRPERVRLLFVNPNSTMSMTETIAAAARAVAAPDVEVIARTSRTGPASIQGPEDGEAAIPGLLAEIRAAGPVDAVVIGCFDDTGLAEARAVAGRPVIGIGEAAYHAAMLIGARFSVVTTLAVSVPVIEANLASYGISGACVRVRASGVPVLEVETPAGIDRISEEIARAVAEDEVSAIVLGCAGMADLAAEMQRRHGLPVIDGVAAACGLARALAALG